MCLAISSGFTASNNLRLERCFIGQNDRQIFTYDSKTNLITHKKSGKCAELKENGLILSDCQVNNPSMQWKFENYKEE